MDVLTTYAPVGHTGTPMWATRELPCGPGQRPIWRGDHVPVDSAATSGDSCLFVFVNRDYRLYYRLYDQVNPEN